VSPQPAVIDAAYENCSGSPPRETAPDIQAQFHEWNRIVRVGNSKVACILVVILMPAGISLDYFVYPNRLGLFFVLRILCSALALLLYFIQGSPFGHRHFRSVGMGWFMLPSFFISLMIYFEQGIQSPYYAGLNLVLVAQAWAGQVGFTETIAAFVLTILMYGTACLLHGGGACWEYFNNFYFIVLTGIIGVTGSYFLNLLRFREFALRAELDSNRRQLEANHAKLVELDRAKSSFFANVSHELRTPLTLLIGPLERLRHGTPAPTGAARQELLDIMYNNAMRLLRLINDLLDLVRLDSRVLRVHRTKTLLRPFLEGITNSVAHMAEQRNLRFSESIPESLDTEGYLDQDKVEKIILNLLFNSFKFTPEGGSVEMCAQLDASRLTVTVTDTGKGISATDLPRVFDRFWQAEAAATRSYQGVGIGLALVKEIAEAHGGAVSAESEIGKGTSVRVSVDISPESAEAEPDAAAPQPTSSETSSPAPAEWLAQLYRRADFFPAHILTESESLMPEIPEDSNKPVVLVADDEPDMRRFLVSQISDVYNTVEARNGSEALDLARYHGFDLILLDLMMPGIDGITLTRQLREEPKTAMVPIIILTARADDDSKMQALEAGVTDFLTKPFSTSELAVRCRNLLLQAQLQRNLARKTRDLQAALEQIKETEAQLVHQAKMAALGQLSSGLMHEINNPLNFANTAAHILQKRLQKLPPESCEQINIPLKDLLDGIRRAAGIITGLRSFIHPDTSNFGQVNLHHVLQTALRFVQINPEEIALEMDLPEDLTAWGNENQLIHLFINLLQNAADSLREKGAPEKRIKISGSLQSGRVLLTCEDNGKGIKASERDKVFDPFFTTKPVGSGVGLGLNICYRIMQNHGGELSLESEEHQFCRFLIRLKPSEPPAPQPFETPNRQPLTSITVA
jgi:signal transduction histidine kinase